MWHEIMSADTRQIVLNMKCARIIEGISERCEVPLEEAVERFYTSALADMINDGVADLHCRSDQYLVDEFLGAVMGE